MRDFFRHLWLYWTWQATASVLGCALAITAGFLVSVSMGLLVVGSLFLLAGAGKI